MTGRVVWVVDGDTIHVRIGKRLEKVRYIGVNAPEVPHEVRYWQHGGEQACKTRIYRETRGEYRGRLKLCSGEYEAARGDIERLLRAACDLLERRRSRRARPTGA